MRDYVESSLPGHIWHRDAFELKAVQDPDGEGCMLEGRMRVGDCVDDEWCVVWLLREISAKWDVAISVFDSDGEFLLIEAADSLPSWVTPSNAENRVWIYNSHLHIVPLSHVSAPSSKPRRSRYRGVKETEDDDNITEDETEDFIAVQDALKLVIDPLTDTLAPSQVETAVWSRIFGYPAAARQHVHVTKAYLPVDIAKALSANPSLVQKPVEAFYTRDALQLRAAHRMLRFPPQPSVLTTVKMTRTAYAQLVGQKFYPPKIFDRWQEKEGTTEWKWRDVGMKIACGFEMLYQESKGRSETSTISSDAVQLSMEVRKEALRRTPDYIVYIENLVSSGYFKGELQGSQLWNALEDKAAAAFIEVRRDDDSARLSFATAVNMAVSQASDTLIPQIQQKETSDDWLNVDAADLDAMLEENLGGKSKSEPEVLADAMDVDVEAAEDHVAKEQASRLQDLAKKVEEFVEGEGDVEGARFADEEFSEEEFSDETEEESDEEMRPADDEVDKVDKAARRAAMDRLVPGLDPSEYGQMPPSFHSNSQRVAPTTIETETRNASSEGPSESPTEPRTRPIRPPILPRDNFEGVDSDDETDEENGGDDEEEEDMPQVVGDVEIDMEKEQDEFLEFARQTLGVSDEQWGDIVRERKGRGVFVPGYVASESKLPQQTVPASSINVAPAASTQSPANPNLDSFEAVMQAMDAQLGLSQTSRKGESAAAASGNSGKASADIDIETAMDAELRTALEKEHDDDGDEAEIEQGMDYNLIKNFLESFRSQAGLSGPVSNLAGRLQAGWTFPRDES
ncbi:hypothetical protein SCP_0109750 [Sparassis crispa]|uniref:SGT1-domain-containing protein n=1 Tax=Sparassis crispa TaxID=139825 RepID=A0A401G7G4_9APHY|nr:hypothetical protein SCP_0109750 [Sparassis crispa]GBE78093.1 hypothetical protein SCP_0109750 [Sparassis crispa]